MQVKFKWNTCLLIVLCVFVGSLVSIKLNPGQPSREVKERSSAKTPGQNPISTTESVDSNDFTANYMGRYAAEGTSAQDDVQLVSTMLESVFLIMKDRMPSFSGNQELVMILQGRATGGMKFLSTSFSYIDRDGQLLDRWHRPLFFHQIRGPVIDVRSAGPDGIMWNEDDVHTGRELE